MLRSGDEDQFRNAVIAAVDRCADNGINTVFLQVRPFCDSVYQSKIFPFSNYIVSDDGEIPGFDVLDIFLFLFLI